MGKSVVIIGKGPSVRKSTKEFVDSFDDVAIINFPPMEDYNHLISNRAKYLFINAGSFRPYSRDFLNKLGLKYIFNISRNDLPPDVGFIPEITDDIKEIYYESDFGVKTKKKFEDKHNFWPSGGIMALDYFYEHSDYDKIGLVGFDLHKPGNDIYYFTKEEGSKDVEWCYNDQIYSSDGKIIKADGHGTFDIQKKIIDLVSKEKEIVWLR